MTARTTECGMHWFGEFILGLIGGTMSIYSFIGWVPVSFGWLSAGTALAVCGILGALLGVYLAVETIREKRQENGGNGAAGESRTPDPRFTKTQLYP